MKLVRARLSPYRLPLERPLETAHGVIGTRAGCLLELETDSGRVGRGDACPFPGFGMERPEELVACLEGLVEAVRDVDPRARRAGSERALKLAPEAPGARFALDCALHEIAAGAEGMSVAEWLAAESGHSAVSSCAVNALVSGRDGFEVGASARDALDAGFLDLKLKLGGRGWDEDLLRVRALREVAGSGVRVRLDAGGSWPGEEAGKRLAQLTDFEIDFLEQPLPAADLEGMAALRKQASALGISLAADEAIVRPEDARRVIERGAADLLILKPAALGGLAAAAELALRARNAGLGCVVTSLIDSAWGRAAALELACALPGPRPADGLATGSLLAFDLTQGPLPREGRLERPGGSGFGLESDPASLARASDGPTRELAL